MYIPTVFSISDADAEKVAKWLENVVYKDKERYEGAIGGAVRYEFTPTSIGLVIKVKAYEYELDLSDYASW